MAKSKETRSKIDFNNPPKGKVYIPIPTDEEDIRRSGIDRKYVVRRKFSATTILCKMVLIDEEAAPIGESYIADIKADCQKEERKGRCKITSPKTGKEIYCPYSCYSDECPMKKRQNVKTDNELSVEDLQENEGFDALGGFDFTSNTALEHLMKEEFIRILKKADPVLAEVFTMHDYGYEADEIREMLHMEKSTYYYQWKRIRDRWKQYNAD